MMTTDEMLTVMREALAHHEREAERLRKMIAAAEWKVEVGPPDIVPFTPAPAQPPWQPAQPWYDDPLNPLYVGDPIIVTGTVRSLGHVRIGSA